MKLYEFVDKFYEMGDMEAPKTVRSKKTLNESYTVSDELFDEYKSDDFKDVGDIHNEIMFNYGDKDLADDVVSRIEVYRNNRDDDYEEDDLDESVGGRMTESFVRQWFPSNEDYFYDDLSGIVEIKKLDTRYDDMTDEEQTLYEFSGTKDAFQHIVDNFGYFEDLEYQKKYQDDELEYSDDIANLQYSDDFYEGLGAGALSESLKPEDLVPGEVYNHKTIPYMDKDEAEEYPEEFEEVKAALVLRKGVYCVPRRYELKYVGTENQTPGWNSALIFDVMGTELSFNTDVLNYIEF